MSDPAELDVDHQALADARRFNKDSRWLDLVLAAAKADDVLANLFKAINLMRPEHVEQDVLDVARADDAVIVVVAVHQGATLNKVSRAVERQYLLALYHRCDGDKSRMGEILLGDPEASRRIQLRMNQLGVGMRRLRTHASSPKEHP